MPDQRITIGIYDNDVIANGVAAAFVLEYGQSLAVTTVPTEGLRPRYIVAVERRDGRPITNDWVQTVRAFASGAAAVARVATSDRTPQPRTSGCEFCRPPTGIQFINRPRGEAYTCPYCGAAYSRKETS